MEEREAQMSAAWMCGCALGAPRALWWWWRRSAAVRRSSPRESAGDDVDAGERGRGEGGG